jgi:hypothetical protein
VSEYFTDRDFGSRARNAETIDQRAWGGLHSLIDTRIDDGSFGLRFPRTCADEGREPFGTDTANFSRTLEAEVPWVTWPLATHQVPETPVVLDILEFCAKAVGQPVRGRFHDYMKHTHIATWDRDAGLAQFVGEVNALFARNGVAFELTAQGRAQRLLPSHLGQDLLAANFATGDRDADLLLDDARRRFLAPKVEDRRDGLEKLWDAFERIKTLEPGANKRTMADALLDRAARPGSKLRQALGEEAETLTRIGNTHGIRHSEVWQEPLETTAQVDFLFGRLFAFIHLVLAASGRLA